MRTTRRRCTGYLFFFATICAVLSHDVRGNPIDLNLFAADSSVTVAPTGNSATLSEDPAALLVFLQNDPASGHDEVITGDPNTRLAFDYVFDETIGENDEFGAILLDADGRSLGGDFAFFIQTSSAGRVSFDLSTFSGERIGLRFQLGSLFGDLGVGSSVTIYNLQRVSTDTDLVAVAFDINPDHTLGGQTTATFTIRNNGAEAVGPFKVAIEHSDDNVIGNADDVRLTAVTIPGLAGNTAVVESVNLALDIPSLFDRALMEDPPNLPDDTVSTSFDVMGIIVDVDDTIAEANEANNIDLGKGMDKDDFTFFPWDVNPTDGQVSPTDAIYVVNRLGQTVQPDNARADLDGNGAITPTDAITVINRLGRLMNSAVDE